MFRIAALNESLSSDGSKSTLPRSSATKEAKESEAFVLYNKALSYLRHGEVIKAEEVFRELIQHPFLQEAKESLEDGQDHVHPGLQLLYSVHKNMAALATQRGDHMAAVESYLEAIKIDTSEVTVWFKIGTLAVKIENYQLAKFGFQQGLECNPKHWPCLDNLITILFALCNYWACLYYISKGLEMDGNYSKGLALRDQIFKEIPSFRRESQHLWALCDSEVMNRQLDPEEAKEFIDEAEAIRKRRRELAKAPDPPRLKLKPLKSLTCITFERLNGLKSVLYEALHEKTWKCVGESLIEMYDLATSSNPPMSLGLRVDMSEFEAMDKDISPDDTKDANQKVSNGTSESKKEEVDPHKSDVHNTELNEGGLQINEIEHPHMEIEHPTTELSEPRDKTNSAQLGELLGGGDASNVGNTKSDAMEPMDCSIQTKGVPEIQEDKFYSSAAVNKENEYSAYSSNTPVAVQTERINVISDSTVQSSSDGCQRRPGNFPTSTSDVQTLPTSALSNISQDDSSAVTQNKLIASLLKESSTDTLSQPQVQFPHMSHQLVPGIIHSSQTGLQKSSTNTVPLIMKSSLTQSELNIISSLAQYNLASGLSFSQSAHSGIGLLSRAHSGLDLSSVSQSSLVGQSGLNLVSAAQSGLNLAQSDPSLVSITQSGLNLVSAPQPGISASRLTQSGVTLTMLSQSGLQQTDSIPHRVMFIPMSSPPGAPGVGTSVNSVSSSISAILSAVTKALTPLTIPVPLPTYSQASQIKPIAQTPAAEEQPSVQISISQEHEEKSPKGSKKGQKRKREVQIMEDLGSKRRSARVRSTTKKKEEESINFFELLQAFLPSSLKQVQDADSMETDTLDEEQPQAAETSTPGVKGQREVHEGTIAAQSLSEEEKEVKEFLKNSIENSGLVSLMFIFVSHLAKRSLRKWPVGLPDVYIQVYKRVRKHISFPQFMSEEETEGTYQDMGKICLVWAELQLDQWINQSKSSASPITSPRNQSPTSQILPNEKLPKFCQDDMDFIMELSAWSNLLQEEWLQHCVRAFWMKARFNMLQGKIEEALFCFNKILEYLNFSEEEGEELKQLVLPNCSLDNVISRDQVRTLQESLQRCQSLEETQKLYESGNYNRVVHLLLQTFNRTARQKGKLSGIATALPERHSQLMLLQDSLFKIGNYENCLLWGEECFMEAYQQYRMAKDEQSKREWTDTMIHIIKALQKVFDKNVSCIKSLPSPKLVRFAQNLVKVVDITMSVPESVTEMPLGTVVPWILLYQLIKHEEDKLKAMQIKESASEHAFDEGIPSSLMLLNIAHEYLGSRSWCTKSDGTFLLCFMDVLKEKMASNQYDKEINQAFEQCVYCLYGHPNKRGRARQLTDHLVQQIHLTWDRAVDLFEYFKPKTLPEFDSFKSDTISGEVEHLLKKISQLVPEEEKSDESPSGGSLNLYLVATRKFTKIGPQHKIVGVPLEELHNYIEGQTNSPPTMLSERQVRLPILKELYYLLADYYLKVNKEAGKAIKFYLHDICMNPTRLDSWAGMALARMSQLEQKLSSIDLRMDVPIYKKSIAALRCFKRAVEIDATNRKLWIEYGSLAYQLHAHSSRQLRWEKWFPVGDELHQIAQDSRQEMLQISYNCYKKASEGEADGTEEEWLTNYMRGKCLEKMRKPPKEYLYHFVKAAKYIHEENAFYPKRITFAYTTPRLAVEALEMYYRLHVAILKYILKSSDTQDYPLYQKYVEEAANGPFARGMEKRHEKKDGRDPVSHDENSMPSVTTPHRKSKTYQVPSSDHTYVRQKSNSSSVDKYMSEDSFVTTETLPAAMTTSSATEAPKDVQLGVPLQHSEPRKGIEVYTAKSVSQVESLKDRIECVSPSRTEESGKEKADENLSKAIATKIPQDPVVDIPVVHRFVSPQTTKSKLDEDILQLELLKTGAMESTDMQTDPDKGISVDIDVSKDVLTGPSGAVPVSESEDEIDLSIGAALGPHLKLDQVGPTSEVTVADESIQRVDKSPNDSVDNRSAPVRYPSSQTFSVSSFLDLSEESEEGSPSVEVSPETEAKKEQPVTSRGDDGKSSSDKMEQPVAEGEIKWTSKQHIDQPELKRGLTASVEEQNHYANPVGLVLDDNKNDAGDKMDANETPEEVKKDQNEAVTMETDQGVKEEKMEVTMDAAKDDEYDQDDMLLKEKTRDTAQIKSDVTRSEGMVTLETKSMEKTELQEAKIGIAEPTADRQMESEEELKRSILDRCKAALELCLQRFPTHYKSLYRLAHMYMCSPQHKNLEYARDLLLGNPEWQNLSYMPTQGLFTDRKQSNFFQGIWKIPIEEIDRSGSFPTHLNRSVALLLELLKEQGDFLMLNKVHMQLLRSPDSGKKYLRDAERVYLAKLAYTTALEVIEAETQKLKTVSDEGKKIKFLMDAYKVWEYAAPKTAILGDRINDLLAQAYKAVKKTNLQATNVLIEQAIRFCRQQQYEQAMRKANQSSSDGANSEDVKSPMPASVEKNDIPLSTSPAETCTAKMVSDPHIPNKSSSYSISATDLPTQTVSIETEPSAIYATNMNAIQSKSKTGKMEETHDDGNFPQDSEHKKRSDLASQVSGAESKMNNNSENEPIKTEPVLSTQTSQVESEKSVVIYLSDSSEPSSSPRKHPSTGKQHQESVGDVSQSSVMDDSSKEVSQSSVAGDLTSAADDVSQSSTSDDLSQSDDEEDVSQSNVGESVNQSSVADDTSESSMEDDDSSQSSTAEDDEPSQSTEEKDDLSSESSSGTPDNSSDEDYTLSDDMETESSSDSSFSDLENSQSVPSIPQTGSRAALPGAFPVHLVKNTMATLSQPKLQPKSFQDQFLKAISQSFQSKFIQSVQADTSRFQVGAGTSITGTDLTSRAKVTHELINSPDSLGESKDVPSLPVVEQGMSDESGDDDDDDVIMICSSPEAGAQVKQGHESSRDTSQAGTRVKQGHESSKDTSQAGTRVKQGVSDTEAAINKVMELCEQMDKSKN